MKYMTLNGEPVSLTPYQELQALGYPFVIWYRTNRQKDGLLKFRGFKTSKEAIRWIRKNRPQIKIASAVIVGMFRILSTN